MKTTTETSPSTANNLGPIDLWQHDLVIAPNDFKYKSLSNWACNTAIGCNHGCKFCSVPSTSTVKQGRKLLEYGVADPDAEWGQYVLLRRWDEHKFLLSLNHAETTPIADLKPDGNRAVIFCSTTDAYQVIRHPDPTRRRELATHSRFLVRRSLELIRDHSTLNVRILTRSPMAREDFDLFKSFGDRLVFGMSVPTLNNRLAKIYEPNAPAPSQRLKTLQEARKAGLHVYVAMAPTYPECDEADLRATLTAIKELDPITIFHEPINIRAENVARIAEYAATLGENINTEVFRTRANWREYALGSLLLVHQLAKELGLEHCLHLWPDADLGSRDRFLELRELKRKQLTLTNYENQQQKQNDEIIYEQSYLPWLQRWWNRVSEWPGKG